MNYDSFIDREGVSKSTEFETVLQELYKIPNPNHLPPFYHDSEIVERFKTTLPKIIAAYLPIGIIVNSNLKNEIQKLAKIKAIKDSFDSCILPNSSYQIPLSLLGISGTYNSQTFEVRVKGIGAKRTRNPAFYDLISTEEQKKRPFGGQAQQIAHSAALYSKGLIQLNKLHNLELKFAPTFGYAILPEEFLKTISRLFKNDSFDRYFDFKDENNKIVQEFMLTPSTLSLSPLDTANFAQKNQLIKVSDLIELRKTITRDVIKLIKLMSVTQKKDGNDFYSWYGLKTGESTGQSFCITPNGAFFSEMEKFHHYNEYKSKAMQIQTQAIENALHHLEKFYRGFNAVLADVNAKSILSYGTTKDYEKVIFEENKNATKEMLEELKRNWIAAYTIEKENREELVATLNFPLLLPGKMQINVNWQSMELKADYENPSQLKYFVG